MFVVPYCLGAMCSACLVVDLSGICFVRVSKCSICCRRYVLSETVDPGLGGPSRKQVDVARGALHLREVVDQVEVLTFNQFVPLALLWGHPLNLVLHFALQLRVMSPGRCKRPDGCQPSCV